MIYSISNSEYQLTQTAHEKAVSLANSFVLPSILLKRKFCRATIAIMFLMFFSPEIFAQTYTIENTFQAYFPSKPRLNDSQKQNNFVMKSYEYTDEENLIIFNGTVSIFSIGLKNSEHKLFLKNGLDGQVKSLGGYNLRMEYVRINNCQAIVYSFNYTGDGHGIKKIGIMALKNETFINWAIQGIDGMSTKNIEDIFKKYKHLFKIL